MAKITDIQFIDFGPIRVIGKEIRKSMKDPGNPIPAFWDQCFNDGTVNVLQSLPGMKMPDLIGWMGDMDEAASEFVYIVGMFMEPETEVPDGFVYRDLPAVKMAVGYIKGREDNGDIYQQGMDLTLQAAAGKGYQYDASAGYAIEVYNYKRFVIPMEKKEPETVLDYYVPCVPVQP